ncbi:hypothetical protein T484DRAFT_1747823 [Baffinella frigidus]|nr:hypothetical protein T484DRAFT_1747823 [Cryptophyta sp. CCMP2293]
MAESVTSCSVCKQSLPPNASSPGPTSPAVEALFSSLLAQHLATEEDLRSARDALTSGTSEIDLLERWTPLQLEIGREVWLAGLVARRDLNGERGIVTSFNLSTHRFGVRLLFGEHLAVLLHASAGGYDTSAANRPCGPLEFLACFAKSFPTPVLMPGIS